MSVDAPYADDRSEGRIRRGWRLTREAWRVILSDRTTLVLAIASALLATVVALLVLWGSGWLSHPHERGRLYLTALIAYWPSTFVASFVNVALAAAAAEAMRGGHLGLREALGVARRRTGQIALWSLLASGVGIVLQEIASRLPWGGRLATWLLGTAWSLATLFAIPVIALEGCTATGCVRRSGQLLKRRWGEGVTGTVTITAWMVFALFPIVFAAVVVMGATGQSFAVTLAVEMAAVVLLSGLAGAARNVFAVALYRYAADGEVGAFDERDLAQPFTRKRRRGLFRRT
jgi:hypothetical protein